MVDNDLACLSNLRTLLDTAKDEALWYLCGELADFLRKLDALSRNSDASDRVSCDVHCHERYVQCTDREPTPQVSFPGC